MKIVTAGDSHGEKLVVIVEDVPFGIPLCVDDINFELARRSKGFGRSERQTAETNEAHIVSGVANGRTTGAPVCIEIENACANETRDAEDAIEEQETSEPASEPASEPTNTDTAQNTTPRPGHADLPAAIKFGVDDMSQIRERSSARETAAQVAAGTIAKNMLAKLGAEVYSFTTSVGSVSATTSATLLEHELPTQAEIELDPLRCADSVASKNMQEEIERAIAANDTLGGTTQVVAVGLPIGLGSCMQSSSKLDAQISAGIMSINSVKSVAFGNSEFSTTNVGSAVNDQFSGASSTPFSRSTNYAGGIEGGITNGMPLVVNIGVKPLPTVGKPMRTINLDTMESALYTSEMRHDTCVVPAVGVIAEAKIAITLANAYCDKFGRDSISEIIDTYDNFKNKLKLRVS